MKTKHNTGKFLVWFCNRVYALANLFYGDDDEIYVSRLPEIEAGLFEIRNARLKMGSIYGQVEGMNKCLSHLDNVVYQVEKFVVKGRISFQERKECMDMLFSCAGELANVWSEVYFPMAKRQQTLKTYTEGPEKALLPATPSESYKIYGSMCC